MIILNKIVSFIRDGITKIREGCVDAQEKAVEAKRAECQEFMNVVDGAFGEYRDPNRCSYKLSELMVLVLLAKAAGKVTIEDINVWINEHTYELAQLHTNLSGTPSTSTIGRFMRNLDPAMLQKTFSETSIEEYTRRRKENGTYETDDPLEKDVIAFDGQNIRSTQLLKKQQDEEGPLRRETGFNVVSLTSKNEKMAISQRICTKKNQEVRAAFDMLTDEEIDISGTILTADALNTRPIIAQIARQKHADWLLNVKYNESTNLLDREQITEVFTKVRLALRDEPNTFNDKDVIVADFTDIEGGQYIQKRIIILPASRFRDVKNLSLYPDVAYFALIITSSTLLRCEGVSCSDESIFMTSLRNTYGNTPEGKKKFAQALIRAKKGEWNIETFHQFLDHDFDQDNRCVKSTASASNLTILNKIVLNILLKEREEINSYRSENSRVSLQHVMISCDSNLSYAFDLLVSNHIWKIDETLSAEEELVNHMTSNVEQLELDEYEELMQSNTYLSSEDHNYPQARSKEQEDEETLKQLQQPDMLMDAPLDIYTHSLKRRRRHAVESQRTA